MVRMSTTLAFEANKRRIAWSFQERSEKDGEISTKSLEKCKKQKKYSKVKASYQESI